jgi:hypothetical protein
MPALHTAIVTTIVASMIAAGVVTATLGLVAGGVLLGHGLRERRGRLARVQVAPTVAGLLVVGRF